VRNQLDHKAEGMRRPPGVQAGLRSPISPPIPPTAARQRTYPGMLVQTAASASISPPRSPHSLSSSVRKASEIPAGAVFQREGRTHAAAFVHLLHSQSNRDMGPAPSLPARTRNAEGIPLDLRQWRIPTLIPTGAC
jgi:hypothetical protein